MRIFRFAAVRVHVEATEKVLLIVLLIQKRPFLACEMALNGLFVIFPSHQSHKSALREKITSFSVASHFAAAFTNLFVPHLCVMVTNETKKTPDRSRQRPL
jgi:hypothetical protein